MPKIISYTPPWLSRPAPGFHLFSSSASPKQHKRNDLYAQSSARSTGQYVGPRRTIARRGTEIFVVVNNEIRWSDLCMLKDDWEEKQGQGRGNGTLGSEESLDFASIRHEGDNVKSGYTLLKFSVSEQIQQLSISPNGSFLAILTSHTVHVAILPKSSCFDSARSEPFKLKTYTLGPTTHVLSQSRVVRALWHPCGVSGKCLVTITADAVVRIWELECTNRWSFDTPSFAIDLKKLALGTSEEEDFVPYRLSRNKGFSSDMVGMEAVSATFGGTGSSGESAWSAMTLWISMKDGDVYALCPLLPAKWQPSSTLIPSLSTSAVSKKAMDAEEDPLAQGAEERRRHHEQYLWIADIDSQEPSLIEGENELSPQIETYSRPSYPGPIPKLQGPFQIYSEDSEEDLEITDIHVIAARADLDELTFGEDSDSESELLNEEGLSAAVICLMTKDGKVHLCLDLDGVEAQWLPPKKLAHLIPSTENPRLVPFEVLDTLRFEEDSGEEWPTFTPDVSSPYAFFVTHNIGVFYFSLDPWLQSLESEFQNASVDGTQFRVNVLRSGLETLRERVLRFPPPSQIGSVNVTTACVVLEDSDLGYFLLTASAEQPYAVVFDRPITEPLELSQFQDDYQANQSTLTLGPVRSVYQPPASLWTPSELPTYFDKHIHGRLKKTMKDEIRLSAGTLELMTQAHRILSQETHQLGVAIADLFRRCDRLQHELRDQIKRVNAAAYKIEELVSENENEDEKDQRNLRSNAALEKRLDDAEARQQKLLERYESLRKRATKPGIRRLSQKEESWVSEIEKMGESVLGPENDEEAESDEAQPLKPWQRYNEAKILSQTLLHTLLSTNKPLPSPSLDVKIPPQLRKAKAEEVDRLLQRESALIDAATTRLAKLDLVATPFVA